ncbi:hypothetical protein A3SI_07879 [Nitritalea halalkaliphila LW7]|uniref:Uncharacterized protein n=1 Tax=Nitritalea halalkaliphila LW7 TaxID=1189621 RepID=I5C5T8_9BACT|nr:hypothetical protein [Nitritalea halalkaliphila]EIM77190.1 hypothetical protein A3SI_07879 [Nitritalea halalkaliphila LW7]
MNELSLYAVAFLLLIGHTLAAAYMYKKVHADATLDTLQKNEWKLKALIFPAYYWFQYQRRKQ